MHICMMHICMYVDVDLRVRVIACMRTTCFHVQSVYPKH